MNELTRKYDRERISPEMIWSTQEAQRLQLTNLHLCVFSVDLSHPIVKDFPTNYSAAIFKIITTRNIEHLKVCVFFEVALE